MDESNDTSNWRKVVIRTDGLKWMIDSNETNSSMLEILAICEQILSKFKNV